MIPEDGPGMALRYLAGTALVWAAIGCAPQADRRPNVLLILIDTLRADALHGYGAPSGSAPNLERIAREGVLFERVIAPSSWTKTSMASILTGRDPNRHGVRRVGDALPDALVTLAEGFSEGGYRTLAVNTNPWLQAQAGFAAGFERYETLLWGHAETVGQRALELLDEEGPAAPTLLYLHYMDVHAPYTPGRRYFTEPPLELPGEGVVKNRALERRYRKEGLSAPGVEARVRALYAAELLRTDAAIGVLLEELRARRFLDGAIVAVTSDHGEGFREHGTTEHGWNFYPEVYRVPLILRGPGLPEGRRVRAQVRSIDLAPTLLELAGLPRPPTHEGLPLVPLEELDDRTALGAVGLNDYLPELDWAAVVSSRYLYLRERTHGRVEFYDLEADPGATRDLGPLHPELARHADREGPATPPPAASGADLDPASRERLRALGYLQDSP
jgi:arylsulfatase A-like enzyme